MDRKIAGFFIACYAVTGIGVYYSVRDCRDCRNSQKIGLDSHENFVRLDVRLKIESEQDLEKEKMVEQKYKKVPKSEYDSSVIDIVHEGNHFVDQRPFGSLDRIEFLNSNKIHSKEILTRFSGEEFEKYRHLYLKLLERFVEGDLVKD